MDDEVDVIVHGGLCVQRVASQVVVLVSFQEQMSEAHQAVVLEGDHHFVAQAKRDQLGGGKVKQRYSIWLGITAPCAFRTIPEQ